MRNTPSLILVILILIVLGCTCPNPPKSGNNENLPENNQSSNTVQQSKQCELKLEQAPEIKGLRLGMTTADVQKKFPQFKERKTDEFGSSEIYLINGDPDIGVPDGIKVKGLDNLMVRLIFLKGRVISVAAYHPPNVEGVKLETYQDRIRETLKLPRKLEKDSESSDYQSLTCDGFKVKSGEQRITYKDDWFPTTYWFYSVEETAAIKTLEDQKAQAYIENEQKQKKERENRANSFKP